MTVHHLDVTRIELYWCDMCALLLCRRLYMRGSVRVLYSKRSTVVERVLPRGGYGNVKTTFSRWPCGRTCISGSRERPWPTAWCDIARGMLRSSCGRMKSSKTESKFITSVLYASFKVRLWIRYIVGSKTRKVVLWRQKCETMKKKNGRFEDQRSSTLMTKNTYSEDNSSRPFGVIGVWLWRRKLVVR